MPKTRDRKRDKRKKRTKKAIRQNPAKVGRRRSFDSPGFDVEAWDQMHTEAETRSLKLGDPS